MSHDQSSVLNWLNRHSAPLPLAIHRYWVSAFYSSHDAHQHRSYGLVLWSCLVLKQLNLPYDLLVVEPSLLVLGHFLVNIKYCFRIEISNETGATNISRSVNELTEYSILKLLKEVIFASSGTPPRLIWRPLLLLTYLPTTSHFIVISTY